MLWRFGKEVGMSDLRSRAEAFLRRPFPLGQRAPANLTDGLITCYVAGGPWDDRELLELLSLCLMNAQSEAARQEGELRAFYEESAAVLQGIQTEVSGSGV
jgi:hypothetical protein